VRWLVSITLIALLTGCGGGARGPLGETSGNSSWATGPVRVNQVLVVSVLPIATQDFDVVVFDRLEPADSKQARGLRLRYAVVRGCNIGGVYGWPPSECHRSLMPVEGFRYEGDPSVSILVGASSSRPGVWFIPAFRLHYRMDGRKFAAVYHQGLKIRVS
jgi:hypothetical protein